MFFLTRNHRGMNWENMEIHFIHKHSIIPERMKELLNPIKKNISSRSKEKETQNPTQLARHKSHLFAEANFHFQLG